MAAQKLRVACKLKVVRILEVPHNLFADLEVGTIAGLLDWFLLRISTVARKLLMDLLLLHRLLLLLRLGCL